MARATTVRFTDEIFARLDQAAARTGLPVNSIVIAACLEWMQRHAPEQQIQAAEPFLIPAPVRPRWSTLRRAVEQAVGGQRSVPLYPFESFTGKSQALLTAAQNEATNAGHNYIGTEHMLLAAFDDPSSHAALILASLTLNKIDVRAAIDKALQSRMPRGAHRIVPTARVKRVIEIAFDLCSSAGDARVSTGHILLALATEDKGLAAQVMDGFGVSSDRIKTELEKLSEPEA